MSGKAILCTLLVLSAFFALSLAAEAVPLNISDCSYNISFPGEFVLNETSDSTGGSCINISTGNVSLDCQGFRINGSGTNVGIYANYSSNITIKNCNIVGFASGIRVESSSRVSINNVNITNTSFSGIVFTGVNYSTVANSSSNRNTGGTTTAGIQLFGTSSNNTFVNNSLNGNSHYGIYVFTDSHDNNITDNRIINNTDYGIYLRTRVNHTLIFKNNITNNTYGIVLENAGYTNISGNTLNFGEYAIYLLSGSTRNIIDSNLRIYNTTNVAIYIADSSDSNNVTNNILFNNTVGVYLLNSGHTLLKNNTIRNNTAYGLFMRDTNYSNISRNTIELCSVGIYSDDNTGNRASTGNIFDRNNIYNTTSFAIQLAGVDSANITNNNMTNNSVGLSIGSCSNSTIQNNIITDTAAAISLSEDNLGLIIPGNKFYNNTLINNTANPNPVTFSFDNYHVLSMTISARSPYAASNQSVLPRRNIGEFISILDNTAGDYMTITINYSHSDLAAANVVESSLGIYRYNSTTALWELVPSTISATDNLISANITSFSPFGVLGASNCGDIFNDTILLTDLQSNSTCFNINASNITLNCNGYTILGNRSPDTYGIHVNVSNVTVTNCKVYNFTKGIYVEGSKNSTISNNTLRYNLVGLEINPASEDNVLRTNTYSDSITSLNILNSTNNRVYGDIFNPNLVAVSFAFFNGSVNMTGITSPPATTPGVASIVKYINITKTTGDWILLNISYLDSDITGVIESTLSFYEYVAGAWAAVASTVDQANNVVYANISSFSDFGLFGTQAPGGGSGGSGGGGGGGVRRANTTQSQPPQECFESWTCGAWTECAGGTQTRECADLKACGTTRLKPRTGQECTLSAPAKAAQPAPEPAVTEPAVTEPLPLAAPLPESKPFSLDYVFYGLSVAALIALGAYLYWLRRKK